MQIPHLSISMLSPYQANNYTLHMQTDAESFSGALRDIIDHLEWGYDHNKLVFIYEKKTSIVQTKEILILTFL